jgi:hypothetical protein
MVEVEEYLEEKYRMMSISSSSGGRSAKIQLRTGAWNRTKAKRQWLVHPCSSGVFKGKFSSILTILLQCPHHGAKNLSTKPLNS